MIIQRLYSRIVQKREYQAGIFLSFLLSPALFYTYKIDKLDQLGELAGGTVPLLTPGDAAWIILIFLISSVILSSLLTYCAHPKSSLREPVQGKHWLAVSFIGCILVWLPFLLVFYPAPGMNDTVFVMNHPFRGMTQFPWLYSLVYGMASLGSRTVFGTAEPAVFVLSLLQVILFSAVLTGCGWFIYQRNQRKRDLIIFILYAAFFPMTGNYAIAAVRDGLYGAGLLLSFCILIFICDKRKEIRTNQFAFLLIFSAALLLLMLFRNNGFLPALILTMAVIAVSKWGIRCLFLFIAAFALAYGPGYYFLHERQETPLFQEKIAIPMQQMGRVIAAGGIMNDETRRLASRLLPLDQWKEHYSPYTVDFIKWDDYFDHEYLNHHKNEWLSSWVRTGLDNPRLYMEGWMTETYAVWNLDPLEWNVQSRFGYALTEENMKTMTPASNDQLAVGNGPLPASVKAWLGTYMWEGSRFLGAGFSLWISLFCGAVFYVQRRSRYLLALLPLWGNAATLLLATPASSVFRYSFGFVLILPLLFMIVSEASPKKADSISSKPHAIAAIHIL